jgi:hypothetical protein
VNFFSATTRQLQEASEPFAADLGDVIERASASLAGVVDAAERAAAEIRAEASAAVAGVGALDPGTGRGRLVAELAATLADRADGLSREARELAATLDRASATLTGPG